MPTFHPRAAKLDPFLVFYLANKRAQDALERVPAETQSVIDEGIVKVRELIQRAASGDPLAGRQRTGTRPLSTTETAPSPALALEVKGLLPERSRRSEVTLAHGTCRRIIIAYVLATTTVAFTSWAVSGYSVHTVPTPIVVTAFVSGVASASVLYERRRP